MSTTVSSRQQLHDAQLLELCLGGEREAFGELVARYQRLVCAQAYAICGDLGPSAARRAAGSPSVRLPSDFSRSALAASRRMRLTMQPWFPFVVPVLLVVVFAPVFRFWRNIRAAA